MSESELNPGVSIVICCHNSAGRLKPTLEHLKRQVVPPGLAWEVLVIDNASTDDTARVAPGLWNDDKAAPLRVVAEPKMGLSNARARGFAEARFDLVSFVDDDNWVAPGWVAKVFEIMASHPEVGACGGRSEAVFEVPPPEWFERYQGYLAIGSQSAQVGDITEGHGWLWGAGLTVRKAAWEFLTRNGFHPLLSDRSGTRLTTGGDIELTYALRLSGWRLWYDESLSIKHNMPAGRIEMGYLRRLMRSIGAYYVDIYPYFFALQKSKPVTGKFGKFWIWKFRETIEELFRLRIKMIKTQSSVTDLDDVLMGELFWGKVTRYLRKRGQLDKEITLIREAQWNTFDQDRVK